MLLLWVMAKQSPPDPAAKPSILPLRVVEKPKRARFQPTLTGGFVGLKTHEMTATDKYNKFQEIWYARNKGKFSNNKVGRICQDHESDHCFRSQWGELHHRRGPM